VKTFKLRGPEAREVIARGLAEERRLASGSELERLDYLEPLLQRHLARGGDDAAIAAVLLVLCDPSRRLRLNLAADIALQRGAAAEAEIARRTTDARTAAPEGGRAKAKAHAEKIKDDLDEMLVEAQALKSDGVVRKVAAAQLAKKYGKDHGGHWSEDRIYVLIGGAKGGRWPRGNTK
jgi:ParB-like chromosome segregation protein Spo0J